MQANKGKGMCSWFQLACARLFPFLFQAEIEQASEKWASREKWGGDRYFPTNDVILACFDTFFAWLANI